MEVECLLHDGDRSQEVVELVVGDRLALVRDALVHPFEVRARVRTDRQANGGKELRDHACRRRLAVRPREMHGGILELR